MTADPQAKVQDPPDDSGIGLAMFVIFTAAILIVTGGVALLAFVNSWWMLGAVFAVHVGMTAIVTATIVHSASDQTLAGRRVDGDAAPAGGRPEVRPPRASVAAHS